MTKSSWVEVSSPEYLTRTSASGTQTAAPIPPVQPRFPPLPPDGEGRYVSVPSAPTAPLRTALFSRSWGRNMDRSHSLRVAYLVFALGIIVALLVQVSLIGLWLFAGQSTLYLHKEFGHAITLAAIGLLILAFAGRLPRLMKWITTLLSVILVIQTEIFAILPGSPLRAFHPVLPLVIFSLAAFLAYSAIPLARGRSKSSSFPLSIVESRAN